jgi:hypothetical protein
MKAGFDRRRFMAVLGGFGLSGVVADRLWAAAEETGTVTAADLAHAEKTAGLEFTDAERELMVEGVNDLRADYAALREVPLPNSVAPALHFDPRPAGFAYNPRPRRFRPSTPAPVSRTSCPKKPTRNGPMIAANLP